MQYESKEALSSAIAEYSRHFLQIPDTFDVQPEYLLEGISADDFAKAFKDYRNLMANIYAEMADNPDGYDFVTTDKKGNFKNTKQPIQCITWLMYALGKVGEVQNRTLVVSSQKINEIFAGKHGCIVKGINNSLVNKSNLFHRLIAFGFHFSISDFDKIEQDFTVTIAGRPDIMVAVKAFALSWYADVSFNCDYAGFNYHVFSVGFAENLPYKHLYIATSASEKTKQYMETVIAGLAGLGYKLKNIRHHGFRSNVWMYKCCFFYQNGDNIWMNCPAHYAPKHKRDAYFKHLEAMPEKYRSRKLCAPACRKICATRVIEMEDGKKVAYCSPHLHLHNLNQLEDIPYLINLIKATFKSK
ncbi:MAG: hypothetical protein FWG38_07730 [Defluviitaleaceae bacterium]|nr:hypothetical protein [Defluviitaleaceae bacterium]